MQNFKLFTNKIIIFHPYIPNQVRNIFKNQKHTFNIDQQE